MPNFVDNYGLMHRYNNQTVTEREKTYVVIKKDRNIVCCYDPTTGLYAFPDNDMVELKHEPTIQFSITANICEDGKFIKEKQHYLVFDVNGAEIENTPLQWCTIDDVLVNAVNFDATQKSGFKNFLVRVK